MDFGDIDFARRVFGADLGDLDLYGHTPGSGTETMLDLAMVATCAGAVICLGPRAFELDKVINSWMVNRGAQVRNELNPRVVRDSIVVAGRLVDDLHWNMFGRAAWRGAMVALMSSSNRVPLPGDVCRIVSRYCRPRVKVASETAPWRPRPSVLLMRVDNRVDIDISVPDFGSARSDFGFARSDLGSARSDAECEVAISARRGSDKFDLSVYGDLGVSQFRLNSSQQFGPTAGKLIWQSFDLARHMLAPNEVNMISFEKVRGGEWSAQ